MVQVKCMKFQLAAQGLPCLFERDSLTFSSDSSIMDKRHDPP